jgi:hypothetical protein
MQNSIEASPPLIRVILYVKKIPKLIAFYQLHFNLYPLAGSTEGWVELASPNGGCIIALHQAAKTQASGAAIKLVFAVADVRGFKASAAKKGLKFGTIHTSAGFEFANAKDPAGNSISISSRGL